MDILSQIREDYGRFPLEQTYGLYTEDVYFKDPLTSFHGVHRYQKMIGFMQSWFRDIHLDLHDLQQNGNQIESRWTLRWTAPVPWRAKMAISGRSELQLNSAGLITSHIDYWDCSVWSVVWQLVRSPN